VQLATASAEKAGTPELGAAAKQACTRLEARAVALLATAARVGTAARASLAWVAIRAGQAVAVATRAAWAAQELEPPGTQALAEPAARVVTPARQDTVAQARGPQELRAQADTPARAARLAQAPRDTPGRAD
jgi:hypothetical protein